MSLYGIAVAAAAWWLIDIFTVEQFQGLSRGTSAVLLMLGIIVVVVAASTLLLLSRPALFAAAGAVIVGIALGSYGTGSALITLWSHDAQFVLLRGAHEPAI